MILSEITSITEKCFNGEPSSCSHACVFGLDVRALMEKAAKGKWASAYKAYRNAVVFPAVVSSLCPADCKEECGRIDIGDEPVDIPLIERAVVEFSKKKTAENYAIPPKEQSVAIVGAGVSGLACALDLAQKKYAVTVFDKNPEWGGALRRHSDFGDFSGDFDIQFSAVSIVWNFNNHIKKLETLSNFDAVYIATGGGNEDFGLLDGYVPLTFSTKTGGVFLGGGITGAGLTEAIIAGTNAARQIEAYMQTGRTDAVAHSKANCSRHVVVKGASPLPRVIPSSGCGYSDDEAMREASRCMLCDCAVCFDSCEMLGDFHKKPGKAAMEVYTDSKVTPPYSTHTITRETYSCNMCSHCKSVCPEGINMGEVFLRSRRDRYESGAAPYAMHDFWLREMEFHTIEASLIAAPRGAIEGKCRYVFYPGCQLGANEPEHVLKTYGILSSSMDCGIYLGCCGAPAHWAGDQDRFNKNLESIRNVSKALGDPVFIFACSTCETVFSENLPEIPRTSLYQVLMDAAALKPDSNFREAAIFDPCAARDNVDMMASVRSLAVKSGIQLEELPERNRCCGYGGLIRGGNPGMFEKLSKHRADMSDKPYIVYCSNCQNVFRPLGKKCVHILDIALGLPAVDDTPLISERRSNSIHIKTVLSRELKNEVYTPEPQLWDEVKLVIDTDLAVKIDKKLISEEDIKEAIWRAETSGEKFTDDRDGANSACLIRSLLTYWVRYEPLPDGAYRILDAYYHRMRIGEA